MLLGLLAGIVAQTCATMLPATTLEFEWFRDGQPYAQDVLIRTRSGERLYQRRYLTGEIAERVVSCTRTGRISYLTERVGRASPVRIPVGLAQGASRAVGSTTVRRVASPPGAAANMIWFTVASPGVLLYGMRRAAGITEIRTPVRGGYSVLRAIARNRADRAAADSQFAAMAQRIEQLEEENRRLRDSLQTLRPPADTVILGSGRRRQLPGRGSPPQVDTSTEAEPAGSLERPRARENGGRQ